MGWFGMLTFHASNFLVIYGHRGEAHQMQISPPLHAYLHGFATEDRGVVVVEGLKIRDLNGLIHIARRCLGCVDGWEGDICVRHIFPRSMEGKRSIEGVETGVVLVVVTDEGGLFEMEGVWSRVGEN